MVSFVKQNDTGASIEVGPAVDITDGLTSETGLLASTVDTLGIRKPGATAVTSIATTEEFTSIGDGYYYLTLASTHVDTVGSARVRVRDDSVCLPFWEDVVILDPDAYDALFATATTTGNLANLDAAISSRSTLASTDISDLATSVWAQLTSVSTATTTFGGILDAKISSRSTLASTDLNDISASAVWAEPLAANATATTLYGGLIQLQLDAAISSRSTLASTALNDLATSVWAQLTSVSTATTTFGGILDAKITSRATSNASDVWAVTGALATGAPPLAPTRAQQFDWLYSLSRNASDQTADTKTLFGSATTVTLATAAVSASTTIFTRGQWG